MSFEKDLLLAFSIVLIVELVIFEDFFSSFLFGVHPFILFCLIYQMFFKKHNLFLYRSPCLFIFLFYRQTPFASGPNDTPTEILQRIAGSKLDLRSGTWVTISNEAKVSISNFMIYAM